MGLMQWSAATLLAVALLGSVMMGILYHLSMRGFTKTFGPLSAGPAIVAYGLVAIAGLITVLSVPLTFFLGLALLFTPARKSPLVLCCAVLTCLVSTANLLFWLFYCGGIPGTAQRSFP
jgi:hypothetical protein